MMIFPPLTPSLAMFVRVGQMRKHIIRLFFFLIIRRIKSYCLLDLHTDQSMAADTNLKKQATDEYNET